MPLCLDEMCCTACLYRDCTCRAQGVPFMAEWTGRCAPGTDLGGLIREEVYASTREDGCATCRSLIGYADCGVCCEQIATTPPQWRARCSESSHCPGGRWTADYVGQLNRNDDASCMDVGTEGAGGVHTPECGSGACCREAGCEFVPNVWYDCALDEPDAALWVGSDCLDCAQGCCDFDGNCTIRTAHDCIDAGYCPTGKPHCRPGTCEDVVPCCEEDGGCRLKTPCGCAEDGGRVRGGDSCTFPCNPCTQSCCTPRGTCFSLTPDQCRAEWEWVGADPPVQAFYEPSGQTCCSPNPCDTSPCCFNCDDATGWSSDCDCELLTQSACTRLDGFFHPELTSCDGGRICPTTCCDADDECVPNSTIADCLDSGGMPMGYRLPCTPDPCKRACCFPDATPCQMLQRTECIRLGGVVQQELGCFPDPCEKPCCLNVVGAPDVCSLLSHGQCLEEGGTIVQGADSCTPNPCETGCCMCSWCVDTQRTLCREAGGVPQDDKCGEGDPTTREKCLDADYRNICYDAIMHDMIQDDRFEPITIALERVRDLNPLTDIRFECGRYFGQTKIDSDGYAYTTLCNQWDWARPFVSSEEHRCMTLIDPLVGLSYDKCDYRGPCVGEPEVILA